MSKMTESKKRDFVSQRIVILEQNRELLADKGFLFFLRCFHINYFSTSAFTPGNRAATPGVHSFYLCSGFNPLGNIY